MRFFTLFICLVLSSCSQRDDNDPFSDDTNDIGRYVDGGTDDSSDNDDVVTVSHKTCDGVTCDDPPPPKCDGDSLLTYYAAGPCSAGKCVYASEPTRCEFGCDQGTCSGPCHGVACDDPPEPECDGNLLLTYYATGSCSGGECVYASEPTRCEFGCEQGACNVDPCAWANSFSEHELALILLESTTAENTNMECAVDELGTRSSFSADTLDSLVDVVSSDDLPVSIRREVAVIVGANDAERARAVANALIDKACNGSSSDLVSIIAALGEPAIEPLLDGLGDGTDRCSAIMDALVILGEVAVDPIVELVKTTALQSYVIELIEILGEIGSIEAADALFMSAADLSNQIAATAADSLVRISSATDEPLLGQLVQVLIESGISGRLSILRDALNSQTQNISPTKFAQLASDDPIGIVAQLVYSSRYSVNITTDAQFEAWVIADTCRKDAISTFGNERFIEMLKQVDDLDLSLDTWAEVVNSIATPSGGGATWAAQDSVTYCAVVRSSVLASTTGVASVKILVQEGYVLAPEQAVARLRWSGGSMTTPLELPTWSSDDEAILQSLADDSEHVEVHNAAQFAIEQIQEGENMEVTPRS